MLKRVSIQNFKSLKDVTLDLQKVNLLIGPNNSGKTNFLKALEFCFHSLIDEPAFTFPRSVKYEQIGDNLVDIRLVFESNFQPFITEKYDHLIIEENGNDLEDSNFTVEHHREYTNSLERLEDENYLCFFATRFYCSCWETRNL